MVSRADVEAFMEHILTHPEICDVICLVDPEFGEVLSHHVAHHQAIKTVFSCLQHYVLDNLAGRN